MVNASEKYQGIRYNLYCFDLIQTIGIFKINSKLTEHKDTLYHNSYGKFIDGILALFNVLPIAFRPLLYVIPISSPI